jgi:hypothetical protein
MWHFDPPEDPMALADAAFQLMKRYLADRTLMGYKGKVHATTYHDCSMLGRQFLEVMT